jgi:hypothetical protein
VSGVKAIGTVALAVAVATAGCGGSQRGYEEQARTACAKARASAGTTVASTARATRQALVTLRDLDAPEGQADAAKTLADGLARQQQALDELAVALRERAKPARLRELVGAVDVQGNLTGPAAQTLGVPACGGAADRLADRLLAEDYSTSMHRTFDLLARADRDLPSFTADDPRQVGAAAQRAYDLLGDVSGRLQDLEPPAAVATLHADVVDASYGLASPFSTIETRAESGRVGDPDAALAIYHRRLARMRAAWRKIAARVPKVDEGSVWGSPSGAAEAAALRRKAYRATIKLALDTLNEAPFPKRDAGAAAWARIARAVGRMRTAAEEAHPPEAARGAHRMMLAGLADVGHGFAAAGTAIREGSSATYARAQREVRAGLRELRRAQRRFAAAGLRFDLGAGSGGGSAPAGSGGADGATPA